MLPFKTEPHNAQEIVLLEDAEKPEDRIYELRDCYEEDRTLSMLGSEIASLLEWWRAESQRTLSRSRNDERFPG